MELVSVLGAVGDLLSSVTGLLGGLLSGLGIG